jgi:hypothetical protein
MTGHARLALADLIQHVDGLCGDHQITRHQTRRLAYAVNEIREINIPPIRGPVSYATALHEIGHILGRHQRSRHVMVLEGWAWRWARSNALVWTLAMERSRTRALEWYRQRAAKIDRKRARFPIIEQQIDAALLELPSGASRSPKG